MHEIVNFKMKNYQELLETKKMKIGVCMGKNEYQNRRLKNFTNLIERKMVRLKNKRRQSNYNINLVVNHILKYQNAKL